MKNLNVTPKVTQNTKNMEKKIAIGGRKKVNPREVILLEGDINYTKVYLSTGKTLFVATTLKQVQSPLEQIRLTESLLRNSVLLHSPPSSFFLLPLPLIFQNFKGIMKSL